jgi:hypothetical protein
MDDALAQCTETLQGLSMEVFLMKWLGVVAAALAALTAAIAALGNPAAKWKKWAAGIGVLSSVVSAVVQTLPLDSARERWALAGAHAREGRRVHAQLDTVVNPDYRSNLHRYAISRFVDCAADAPQPTVPPIPVGPGDGVENVGALEGRDDIAPPPL